MKGGVLILGGALLGIATIADDVTGVGTADDAIGIPAAVGMLKSGVDALEYAGPLVPSF